MSCLGYYLGSVPLGALSGSFWGMLIGIALVGGGCGAINMYMERDLDAQMDRTRNRPIPSGRVPASHALWMGLIFSVVGEAVLYWTVNPLTAGLGLVTLFTYLVWYTPAKRVSSLSTLVGAIPGAMPPLMGFTAGYGTWGVEGIVLFGILFLWQIPHFLAIAYIYRDDYARGGFPILSVVDAEGRRTGTQMVLYSLALLPLSLLPAALRDAGTFYFFGAAALGIWFIVLGIKCAREPSRVRARRLFLYSVLYLPALSFLMVWDRL